MMSHFKTLLVFSILSMLFMSTNAFAIDRTSTVMRCLQAKQGAYKKGMAALPGARFFNPRSFSGRLTIDMYKSCREKHGKLEDKKEKLVLPAALPVEESFIDQDYQDNEIAI